MIPSLLRSVGAAGVGNVFAGVLSWAFILLVARDLGPADFSSLRSLLSIIAIGSAPIIAVTTLSAQRIAEARAKGDDNPGELVPEMIVRVAAWAGLGFVAYLALARPIQAALHVSVLAPVILTGLTTAAYGPRAALRGALQGFERFGALATAMSGEAALRLGLALAFPLFRTSLLTVLLLYLASAATEMGTLALALARTGWSRVRSLSLSRAARVSPRVVATTLVFGSVSLLQEMDMLAARAWLGPEDAGIYGAGCAIFKTAFIMLAAAAATVVVPQAILTADRRSVNRRTLWAMLALVTLVLLATTLVAHLVSDMLVQAMLGEAYGPLADWIWLFSLASLPTALVFVMASYHVAMRTAGLQWSLGGGIVVEAVVVAFAHNSIGGLLVALVVGNLIPLAAMLWLVFTYPDAEEGRCESAP